MKLIKVIILVVVSIIIFSGVGCEQVYKKIKTDLTAQPTAQSPSSKKKSKLSLPNKLILHSVPHNPRRQRGTDCGPDSLRMVLNYYEKGVKEGEIVRQLDSRGRYGGVSIAQLGKIARNYGLDAYLMSQLNLDTLKAFLVNRWPPIVSYKLRARQGHAVVLTGYNDVKKRVFVNDPNFIKVRRLPYYQFLPAWKRYNNSCLLIVPKKSTRQDITAAVKKYVSFESQ